MQMLIFMIVAAFLAASGLASGTNPRAVVSDAKRNFLGFRIVGVSR
jgi:hypothetical protein